MVSGLCVFAYTNIVKGVKERHCTFSPYVMNKGYNSDGDKLHL